MGSSIRIVFDGRYLGLPTAVLLSRNLTLPATLNVDTGVVGLQYQRFQCIVELLLRIWNLPCLLRLWIRVFHCLVYYEGTLTKVGIEGIYNFFLVLRRHWQWDVERFTMESLVDIKFFDCEDVTDEVAVCSPEAF